MSLNGVNSNYQAYETNTVSGSDKKVSTKEISKTTAYSGVAATYEHSSQSEGLVAAVNKKASNASIVAQLKADPIAQAKEDISENGYWGVKQTSERIFSFAQALAGDDEEKMTKMKEAFEKGFKEATKTWGKELPDISQNTRDAVLKKFDDYFAGKNS